MVGCRVCRHEAALELRTPHNLGARHGGQRCEEEGGGACRSRCIRLQASMPTSQPASGATRPCPCARCTPAEAAVLRVMAVTHGPDRRAFVWPVGIALKDTAPSACCLTSWPHACLACLPMSRRLWQSSPTRPASRRQPRRCVTWRCRCQRLCGGCVGACGPFSWRCKSWGMPSHGVVGMGAPGFLVHLRRGLDSQLLAQLPPPLGWQARGLRPRPANAGQHEMGPDVAARTVYRGRRTSTAPVWSPDCRSHSHPESHPPPRTSCACGGPTDASRPPARSATCNGSAGFDATAANSAWMKPSS